MSCVLELLRARSWPRAAALAAMTIGVAGCSSEATRLGKSSTLRFRPTARFPRRRPPPPVESRASRFRRTALSPRPTSPPASTPACQEAAGACPPSSRQPWPQCDAIERVAGVRRSPDLSAPSRQPVGHWSSEGGTPITVAPEIRSTASRAAMACRPRAIIQANQSHPSAQHPCRPAIGDPALQPLTARRRHDGGPPAIASTHRPRPADRRP